MLHEYAISVKPKDMKGCSRSIRVPGFKDSFQFDEAWGFAYQILIRDFKKLFPTKQFYPSGGSIKILTEMSDARTDLGMYNSDGHWVKLLFRQRDMYLVGFVNRNGSFQTLDNSIKGFKKLSFGGSYGELTSTAGSSLCTIEAGRGRLKWVLETLSRVTGKRNEPVSGSMQAEAITVCVLMFSEASRFTPIYNYFGTNPKSIISITGEHKKYILNWSRISKCLIAQRDYPDKTEIVNKHIEKIGLTLLDLKTEVKTFEGLQGTVQLLSNQAIEDCAFYLKPLRTTGNDEDEEVGV